MEKDNEEINKMPLPTFSEFENALQSSNYEWQDKLDTINGYMGQIVSERDLSDDDLRQLTDAKYELRKGTLESAFDSKLSGLLGDQATEEEFSSVKSSVLDSFESGKEIGDDLDDALRPIWAAARGDLTQLHGTTTNDGRKIGGVYSAHSVTSPNGIDLFSYQRKKHPTKENLFTIFVEGEGHDVEFDLKPGENPSFNDLSEAYGSVLGGFDPEKFDSEVTRIGNFEFSPLFGPRGEGTRRMMEAKQLLGRDYYKQDFQETGDSGVLANIAGAVDSARRFPPNMASGTAEFVRGASVGADKLIPGDAEVFSAVGNKFADIIKSMGKEVLISLPPTAETARGRREGEAFDWSWSWFADNAPETLVQLGAQLGTGNIPGFIATGSIPEMGNHWAEAMQYHTELGVKNGLSHDEAFNNAYGVASIEAMAVGATTAALEGISGLKLLKKAPIVAEVRNSILRRGAQFAGRGSVEGGTEFLQQLSTDSITGGFRNKELFPDPIFEGDIYGSNAFAAGVLGFVGGGSAPRLKRAVDFGANRFNDVRTLINPDQEYAGMSASQRELHQARMKSFYDFRDRSEADASVLGRQSSPLAPSDIRILPYSDVEGNGKYAVRFIRGDAGEFDEFHFADEASAKNTQRLLADYEELRQRYISGRFRNGAEEDSAKEKLAKLSGAIQSVREEQYSINAPEDIFKPRRKAPATEGESPEDLSAPARELSALLRITEQDDSTQARIEELTGQLGDRLTAQTQEVRSVRRERGAVAEDVIDTTEDIRRDQLDALDSLVKQDYQQIVGDQDFGATEGTRRVRLGSFPTYMQAQGMAQASFETMLKGMAEKDTPALADELLSLLGSSGRGKATQARIKELRKALGPDLERVKSKIRGVPIGEIPQPERAAGDLTRAEGSVPIRKGAPKEKEAEVEALTALSDPRSRADLRSQIQINKVAQKDGRETYDVFYDQPIAEAPRIGRRDLGSAEESSKIIAEATAEIENNADLLVGEVERNLTPSPLRSKLSEGGFVDIGAISQGVAAAYQFAKGKIEAFTERLKALFGETISPFITELWESAKNAVGDYLTRVIINAAPAQVQGGAIQKGGPENSKRQLTDVRSVAEMFSDPEFNSLLEETEKILAPMREKEILESKRTQTDKEVTPEVDLAQAIGEITGTDREFNLKLRAKFKEGETLLEKGIEPLNVLSDELGRIHPSLAKTARKFESNWTGRLQGWHEEILEFVNSMRDLYGSNKEAYESLSQALNNSDAETARRIMRGRGIPLSAYDKVNAVLDDGFDGYYETGRLNLGQRIEGYFPRDVKDYAGYFEFLYSTPLGTEIEQAIRDKERQNNGQQLTEQQKVTIANQVLSSVYRNPGKRPTGVNDRKIKKIQHDAMKFYRRPEQTLIRYIEQAARDIEMRKFFGRTRKDVAADTSAERLSEMEKAFDAASKQEGGISDSDIEGLLNNYQVGKSIGGRVETLMRQGEIDADDVRKIKQLLKDRFNYKPNGSIVSGIRDIGYVGMLAHPDSAMTQLEGLLFSALNHGAWNVGQAILDKLSGNAMITVKDIPGATRKGADVELRRNWIREIGEGTTNVPGAFKMSGFNFADFLDKDILMNSYLLHVGKLTDEQAGRELRHIAHTLDGTVEQAIRDIRDKNATHDVLWIASERLAQMNPIYISEMPMAAIRNPALRLAFQMKYFQIRRLGFLRSEFGRQMREGGRGLDSQMRGYGKFLWALAFMAASNASVDELKDWVMGREVPLRMNVINGALKILFANRFTMNRFKEQPNIGNVAADLIEPAAFSIGSDVLTLISDHLRLATGDESRIIPIRQTKVLNDIPIIGRIYSSNYGMTGLPEIDDSAPGFWDDPIKHISMTYGRQEKTIQRNVDSLAENIYGDLREKKNERLNVLKYRKDTRGLSPVEEVERKHLERLEDIDGKLKKKAQENYIRFGGDIQALDMELHIIRSAYEDPFIAEQLRENLAKDDPQPFISVPNPAYEKKTGFKLPSTGSVKLK